MSAAAAPSPSFLDQWKATFQLPPSQRREAQIGLTLVWTGQKSLHALCAELRPNDEYAILETPIGFLATRFDDVIEGFGRPDVFTVDPYAERMAICTGAFMLGMNPGPRYDHETAVVNLATPGMSQPPLARWIESYCQKLVTSVTGNVSRFDAVQQITMQAPLGFVGHYFGVPGPDAATLTRWVQGGVLYIFNFSTPAADALKFKGMLKKTASQGAAEFAVYLDEVINTRLWLLHAGAEVPDDVLTRLLKMWLTDPATSLDPIGIRRNLGGLLMGGTVAPMGVLAGAIDSLMTLQETNPDAYAMTRQAALDGDDALLRDCMLEASRLGQPNPPSMFRQANQDYVLAKGTAREKLIPKGSYLVMIMSSAMLDPSMIDDPLSFRPGRPDWNYTLYGYGQHECIGRAVGTWLLTYVAKALLKLPGLRRVGPLEPGPPTDIPGGFYPAHLVLEYDRFLR